MSEKRKYTLGEEIFNSVSHGVGACLSVAGTAVMIVASVIHTDVWGIVSSCIYGASLIILYTMSTLYHSFTNKKAKAFFEMHSTLRLGRPPSADDSTLAPREVFFPPHMSPGKII